MNRRDLLLKTLFGSGWIGLRSLATGLPISFLLNPNKAIAQQTSSYKPQYLIFSTSVNGDPVNANVPGTYGLTGVSAPPIHPQQWAPATLQVGSQSYGVGQPWTQLSQPASTGTAPVVNNTVFFHHGTYTVVHPFEHNVLSLMGGTTANEMMVSLFASQLGPMLQTVQNQPISIGSNGAAETLSYQGSPQPNLTPTALASVLTNPTSGQLLPLSRMQHIRDTDLDSLYAIAKSQGNTYQKNFIDQYANSQTQVRELNQSLMSMLSMITNNSVESQIQAATILVQLKVAPVIAIHIPFGGDNHEDNNLANEYMQTSGLTLTSTTPAPISGVPAIAYLQQQLASAGLQNDVSFALLNVFGRNLTPPQGYNGRNHLGNHHCSVMIGSQFQGAVVGGIQPYTGNGADYIAQGISSATGQGVSGSGADIQFQDTMASMALTLGTGLGVPASFLSSNIWGLSGVSGGAKVVSAALKPSS